MREKQRSIKSTICNVLWLFEICHRMEIISSLAGCAVVVPTAYLLRIEAIIYVSVLSALNEVSA